MRIQKAMENLVRVSAFSVGIWALGVQANTLPLFGAFREEFLMIVQITEDMPLL